MYETIISSSRKILSHFISHKVKSKERNLFNTDLVSLCDQKPLCFSVCHIQSGGKSGTCSLHISKQIKLGENECSDVNDKRKMTTIQNSNCFINFREKVDDANGKLQI